MTTNDIRQLVAEKIACAERGDHYALLGVDKDADTVAIADAYRVLTAALQPERINRTELADMQSLVGRVYRAMAEAYSVLADPARRAAWDESKGIGKASANGTRTQTAAPAAFRTQDLLSAPVGSFGNRRKEAAQILQLWGSKEFSKESYEEAEKLFLRALELDPANAAYHLKVGWSILKNTERPIADRLGRSRRYIEHAVALAPYDADSRYCMACYWREADSPAQYRRELEAVLRCNEKHPWAGKELRALDERARAAAEQEEPKKGLLGRLFGVRT